jgi:hypothetical protein
VTPARRPVVELRGHLLLLHDEPLGELDFGDRSLGIAFGTIGPGHPLVPEGRRVVTSPIRRMTRRRGRLSIHTLNTRYRADEADVSGPLSAQDVEKIWRRVIAKTPAERWPEQFRKLVAGPGPDSASRQTRWPARERRAAAIGRTPLLPRASIHGLRSRRQGASRPGSGSCRSRSGPRAPQGLRVPFRSIPRWLP